MVKSIINVKGVPRYAGVVGGNWYGRQRKTRNHGYDVIVGGELFTDCPITLANVTLNPKPISWAPDATSFFPLVGCLPYGRKTSLRKVRTLWHCSRLRSVALYYDWSWWYRQGNRPLQQYLGFTAGRWLWSVQADLIAKFKEAGRWSRRWCMSRVTRLSRSVIYIIVCLSWTLPLITPLPTSPARQKCRRELKLANAAVRHADASAWCCCADAKNTRRS